MRKSISISILLLFITLLSCSRQERDGRLVRVARIVSDHPREAISILDNISYDELSSSDRHYYDFLSIKANDKAYITHKDDSLILDVIKYYSGHEKDTLYAEALYYGGRVYSDMGDYPTALNYFQKSLDQLKAGSENLDLKSRVLSQTGRLLNNIRLYEEAIPYLEETLSISLHTNDTINIIYDLHLLSNTLKKNGEYIKAEILFERALSLDSNLPRSFNALTRMYLADLKRRKGNIDSALLLIRNCPEEVSKISQNYALSLASEIYLKANIPDTAFYYGMQLINRSEDSHKTVAYITLLSPKMALFINRDSLVRYVFDYRALVEKMYNENSNKLALEQRTHYNYQIQERERIKAEKSNRSLKNTIFFITTGFLLIIIIILLQKNRQNKTIIKLREKIDNIGKLENYLAISLDANIYENKSKEETLKISSSPEKYTVGDLKIQLQKRLLNLYNENSNPPISLIIQQSEVYSHLQQSILQKKLIKEDSFLWVQLENIVKEASPNFITNLKLLLGIPLKEQDLHTCLLIKCGVTPTQMAELLGRSKNTIVSRRNAISYKMFNQKLGTQAIDSIIRLL